MPDRADLHAELDRFREAGLTPALETVIDGLSIRHPAVGVADIVVTRGQREQGQGAGLILDVRVTEAGEKRLEAAR